MTNKTIIVGLVALAFVTGSVMTGAMAYAAPNGQPFQELLDAIADLQDQIDDLGSSGGTVSFLRVAGPSITIAPGGINNAFAECPVGMTVTGGGYSTATTVVIITTFSGLSNTNWIVSGFNTSPTFSAGLQAFANCASTSP